jgi:carbon starvation protein
MKIGTIALLAIGVILVNPKIQMPGVTQYIHGGGPIVKGPLFPFVFITIACGAISGFHGLVASGTTPKMVDKERDCRSIGYGAMLMEGLVGITALIAACAMPQEDYVAINTNPPVAIVADARGAGGGLARSADDLAKLDGVLSAHDRELLGLAPGTPASALAGKKVPLSSALALSNRSLASLGYNVDAEAPRATMLDDADFARLGVKVKELPALQRQSDEVVAARTGGGVSLAVGLACTALCVATTILLREARKKAYALVTLLPLAFVGTTTIAAGVESVQHLFWPMLAAPATHTTGLVNVAVTTLLLACVVMVIVGSVVRWWGLVRAPRSEEASATS